MAKRLAVPSKEAQLFLVGKRDSFKASRVQRFSKNTDIPSNQISEIGNSAFVGNSKDVPNVTLTFSALDVGIKIFSALTGTDATAYPAAGVDIVNLAEIDAIIYTKSDTVSDYTKCAHAKKLQIRDFTFNYSLDGESTEDYSAIGSESRWFKRDVVVDKFVTGTTSFTLSQTPIQLKNGNNALSVILDGAYLTEVTAAPATGQYRLVGTTLTTGDSMVTQCLVVYQADPAGTNWSDVSDPLLPVAIKGKDVLVKISANEIPRVQSVSINGNLNTQAVKEMGNRDGIAGYQRQIPTVEGSITVLDTDTELIDLFATGSLNSADTELQPGMGCVTSGISLKIELLDPCDTTSPYTVMKTVYLDNIELVGDAYSVNVGQNAQLQINWRSTTGHCVVYSGAMA